MNFPLIAIDLPRRRGCKTASDRRLTTVSRPFTSADTAYIVVSLQERERGDVPHMQQLDF